MKKDLIKKLPNVDTVEYISSEQGLSETTDRLLGSYKDDYNSFKSDWDYIGNDFKKNMRW